jgi:hypothetical protein
MTGSVMRLDEGTSEIAANYLGRFAP